MSSKNAVYLMFTLFGVVAAIVIAVAGYPAYQEYSKQKRIKQYQVKVYFPELAWMREDMHNKLFKKMDEKFKEDHADYLSGKDKYPSLALYAAFRVYDKRFQKLLTEWVVETDSIYAHSALCEHYEHMGWRSRGSGFARDTSENQFAERG